jgi:hypothetical protein
MKWLLTIVVVIGGTYWIDKSIYDGHYTRQLSGMMQRITQNFR